MNGKEEFKSFVKKNPCLIKYVKDGSMNWQKFYEIYNLYGEEESAWKDYIKKETVKVATAATGVTGFLSWLKNIDLDSVSNGVSSIQRVLGVIGDFGKKDTKTEEYKPRPMYKHFED